MPLNAQEKDALKFQVGMLVESDEPEAVLATLRRIAERKAFGVTTGSVDREEAVRWQRLADVLIKAEDEVAKKFRAQINMEAKERKMKKFKQKVADVAEAISEDQDA